MLCSYHTHTYRCHHAQGEDEEYVLRAIDAGMTELGFADHVPYPMDGYCSKFRMPLTDAAGYFESLTALREKYEEQIKIHIGFEAEYYPRWFEGLLRFLEDYPCDYLIQGQHFLGNEIDPKERYMSKPFEEESELERYVLQVCEGLRTGVFSYLAHPDIANFIGDDATYRKHMSLLCRTAKQLDIPLEINGLGIRTERTYPTLRFWKLAGELGCKAVYGCDAHAPEDVWDAASYETAKKIANDCGLQLLERADLHPPLGKIGG